jgi:hypothetical protein
MKIKSFDYGQQLFSLHSTIVYISWLLLHFILHIIVPGPIVDGIALNTKGQKLQYKCNGLYCMFISILIVFICVYNEIISATYVYDHFLELVTVSIGFSFFFSIVLYIWSKMEVPEPTNFIPYDKLLAPHGHTGTFMYDFFVGRSLNPRFWGLDFKFICEL